MSRANPLVPAADPEARERVVAALLFFATCCSVFAVYWLRWQPDPWDADAAWRALGFTVALMGILLSHEMGHWVTARGHGLRLALPWFLPAPVLVGTFGAVIRWADVPRSRTILLEMGAMGPLAGLGVVVFGVAGWLLAGPSDPVGGDVTLARPLLWWLLSAVLTGGAPPPISPGDPLGFAAWIGALVTAMNLLPLGQLDGGHVAAALFPSWTRAIGRAVTVVLLLAGLFWPGWAVWAALVHLMGTSREPTRDRSEPTPRARRIAWASFAAFCLCFTPVPVA